MVAEGGALLRTVEQMRPDLVVVDMSLLIPGTKDVVHLLKKNSPKTKLIVMSMHDDETVVHEVMASGAEGFVLKRRVAIDLIPSLRTVCQGLRFVSPDVEKSEILGRELNNMITKPKIDHPEG